VVTLVVDTTAKRTLRLTAAVSAGETDTDPSNDQETETTTATFSNLVLRALDAVKAALPGAAITIDDTTMNSGIVDAQASFTRFYLSNDRRFDSGVDALLGSRMIPALVAKASDSGSTLVTIPGDTALGRYFIIGRADADNAVAETAENNRRNRIFQITRPNLEVATLRAPVSAAAGATIAINDTTINKSPLDAGASTTRFFLSTDAVFDAGDTALMNNSRMIPALLANGKHSGSTMATIPGGTAPGKYFLIAVADANAAVTEADETDNTRARRITVTPELLWFKVQGSKFQVG
jgi:trimeric autotransporter adhesin